MITNVTEQLQPVLIAGTYTGLPSSATAVATVARQYTVLSQSIVTTNGTAGVIGVGQKMFIQNADDAACYVALNSGPTASSTNFTFVLKAGTAADDGNGGSVVIDDYAGPVTIAATTGSPRLTVTIYTS